MFSSVISVASVAICQFETVTMKNYRKLLGGLLMVVIAGGAAVRLSAAEVRVGLSTRETYVGLPVTLRVQVANATKTEPPILPNIDGLAIKSLGTPSHSTQITTINGRTTTTTTQSFAFELTPQRAGTFQIPAFTVNVDGRQHQTRAIEFVASTSETGDLMFVEITGKEKQIYVGQALDLTLNIWLRPYSDREQRITLSEGNMWRMISDRTEWGPFAERIQQLAENEQRPVGKETLRKDGNGAERSYYLYQVDATIYPKRPGKIDADNVKIVVDYPAALGRSRGLFGDLFDDFPGGRSDIFGEDAGFSPFGSQLAVKSVRPLVAQAVVEPINVLPIPTADRPADYRGAVGRYQIAVDATPTHVKSGDPINLLIGIWGTGPMELVQAPPLSELPELTADFKVPDEPLAGFVQGERKIFSTSIRPRKAGVTQIPAIPLSYFDPAAAKFVTVQSKPVSIHVDPAEVLALDAIDQGGQTASTNSNINQESSPKDAAPPSLAIFTGDDVLVNQAPFEVNLAQLFTLLAIPPFIVLGILVIQSGARLSLVTRRFRSASRRLENVVLHAKDPREIASAVIEFVTRQCKLTGDAIDAEKVVGSIRASGRRQLAIRCERILNACAGGVSLSPFKDENSLDDLKREVLEWLHDWRAESTQRAKPSVRGSRQTKSPLRKSVPGSSISAGVAAIVLGSLVVSVPYRSAQAAEPMGRELQTSVLSMKLNTRQQQTLLAEANSCYNAALEMVKNDSAEAKQQFAEAADKYQLLVRAGVSNSRLYFNLANAFLGSGRTSEAIANYMRCLRIDPTMREAQVNLEFAQQQLNPPGDGSNVASSDGSFFAQVSLINRLINRYVSPRAVIAMMIIAWFALWIFVGLRVAGIRFPWKSAACASVLVAMLAAFSSFLHWQSSARHLAVVIDPHAAAVDHAGVQNAEVRPGQVVEILHQRGDSVRVRTGRGHLVWLSSAAVAAI
jgi:tetratricopeptide (TPR) repeat protein